MVPDEALEPVCPVCARRIPNGAALAFLRRDNLIHAACLPAAQRRAEAATSGRPASTVP
jgi:hypothetical protein